MAIAGIRGGACEASANDVAGDRREAGVWDASGARHEWPDTAGSHVGRFRRCDARVAARPSPIDASARS